MRLTNLDSIRNQRRRCVKRHVLVLDRHVMTSRELNVKTVVVVAEVAVTAVTVAEVATAEEAAVTAKSAMTEPSWRT